jgi:hypothetical protein
MPKATERRTVIATTNNYYWCYLLASVKGAAKMLPVDGYMAPPGFRNICLAMT